MHRCANVLYYPTTLMAEDSAFLHFTDASANKVQVRAAN